MISRPYILDVTRLVARSWTGRRATGIDRVCHAYLAQLGRRAHAVVQHRGMFRIFDAVRSDGLFELLLGPDSCFRRGLAAFAPLALASGRTAIEGEGAIYINAGHTDFDLAGHARWVRACRLRPVYMIHDLIPITHPHFCKERATIRHRRRVLGALNNAAGIIVNSRATRDELERYSRRQGLPRPPAIAALLAGAELGGAEVAGANPQDQNAPPYFICLGTIEKRKNHMLLLDIWSRLAIEYGNVAPRLVIAGQWGVRSEDVRRRLRHDARLRDHVAVVEGRDDSRIGELIAGAKAMLLPSLAEGFGLPMVEALRIGTPVIASDLPCFREIGQGIPTLLDPLDRAGWRQAIMAFAGNCEELTRQLRLMPHFRSPTWDDHFARIEPWLSALPLKAWDREPATRKEGLSPC